MSVARSRLAYWALGAMLSLSLSACSGGEQGQRQDKPLPDGVPKLMGLEDESTDPVWKSWTVDNGHRVTPAAFRQEAFAFDSLEIPQGKELNQIWSSVAAILESLRLSEGITPKIAATLSVVGATLEPGDTRADITFVTRNTDGKGAWEGLLLRFYRKTEEGAVPAVALFLRRPVGGSTEPHELTMWAVSGFAQAAPVTVSIRRDDKSFLALSAQSGIEKEATGKQTKPQTLQVIMRVLTDSIWKPYTGNSYAERATRAEDDAEPKTEPKPALRPETLAHLPPSEGLIVRDRSIELVHSDSVFPPRMTNFKFEFN